MKIIIEKEISAEVYMLMMEIGKATERKDIISVMKLAAEKGGKLSPDILCRELLNNRPEIIGRNVLERCCNERLMEWTYNGQYAELTPTGEYAAETGIHYQAMRDIYEIVYYDKGLVPCLIDCKGTGQNNFNTKDNEKPSFKEYEVNRDIENNLTEPVSFKLPGNKEEIKVFSIERKGRRTDNKKKINISYTISDDDNDKMLLSGAIKGELSNIDYSFYEGFSSILNILGRNNDWDANNNYLKVSFSDLASDFEKRNFLKNITGKNVYLNYFCQEALDNVKIEGIPVFPRTLKDAEEWFIWLLKNEINDYLEGDKYQEYSNKIRQRFGHFEHDLEIPDSQKLAEIIKLESGGKIPDKYWYLVAPVDLRKAEV